MEKQQQFSNIDIVITGNVAWRDELAWDIKIMYGVIRGLTRNDYYCCYASNDYLAEIMRKSPRTVRGFLNELESYDFIRRDYAYIECNDGKIRRKRAIVPSDLYYKFAEKRFEMVDAYEASKNISSKGGKKLPRKGGEKLPPNNKCIPYSKIKEDITPKPPTGALQAVTSVETKAATLFEPATEPIKMFGTFGNVRLTDAQARAFRGEFGNDLADSLIEQLDSYIHSDGRRRKKYSKRKSDEFYATLRDWALRRKEPAPTEKILINGRDMQRRPYTDEDFNTMWTPLDEDDTGDG